MTSSPSQQSGGSYSDDASSEYSDIGYCYRGRPYPYTPREIGAKLLDFYKFLTTLYIDPKSLHVPPEEGWPDFPEDEFDGFHTPEVREYLRHMPYISGVYQASHMSFFYDYRGIGGDQLSAGGYAHQEMKDYRQNPQLKNPFYWVDDELEDGWKPMICLSYPYGHTNTTWHTLDVLRGYIHEDMIRMNYRYMEIDEALEEWRQELRTMAHIPMPYPYANLGVDNDEEDDENAEHVTLAEALATHYPQEKLFTRYVRQLYRAYGWNNPGQFRRDEAFAMMEAIIETRKAREEELRAIDENSDYSFWDGLMDHWGRTRIWKDAEPPL